MNPKTVKRLLLLEIKAREKAESLVDDIGVVINKFDDKRITKRLETALKEVDKNLHIDEYDWIYLFIEDRSFKGEKDSSGYSSTLYMKNNIIYIARMMKNSDDNLDAISTIEKIIAFSQDRKRDIEQFKKEVKTLSKIILDFKELEKQAFLFKEKYSYTTRDYFGFKIEVRD